MEITRDRKRRSHEILTKHASSHKVHLWQNHSNVPFEQISKLVKVVLFFSSNRFPALFRHARQELADARRAEHDAAIEAREADEFYQETLDWVRSSRRAVEQYAAECRMSRERRLREIQDDLAEARGAGAVGMEWTE